MIKTITVLKTPLDLTLTDAKMLTMELREVGIVIDAFLPAGTEIITMDVEVPDA